MLPADRRLRRSNDFARAVRGGRRAGSRLVVVHLHDADQPISTPPTPSRVGFVVSKAVGGSVVRSQVARRLRHVMRDRLDALPAGAIVVVRALGPAGTASSAAFAADIDRALARLNVTPVALR